MNRGKKCPEEANKLPRSELQFQLKRRHPQFWPTHTSII